MARRVFVVLALSALAGSWSFAAARQQPTIKKVPIDAASPQNDPTAMFTAYCTPCHGREGKGDGPAAPALAKQPSDLTKLSARNGGTFPEVKVTRFIEGSDEVPAHGDRDMPIWGDLFKALHGGRSIVPARVKGLTDYLKSIQQ